MIDLYGNCYSQAFIDRVVTVTQGYKKRSSKQIPIYEFKTIKVFVNLELFKGPMPPININSMGGSGGSGLFCGGEGGSVASFKVPDFLLVGYTAWESPWAFLMSKSDPWFKGKGGKWHIEHTKGWSEIPFAEDVFKKQETVYQAFIEAIKDREVPHGDV